MFRGPGPGASWHQDGGFHIFRFDDQQSGDLTKVRRSNTGLSRASSLVKLRSTATERVVCLASFLEMRKLGRFWCGSGETRSCLICWRGNPVKAFPLYVLSTHKRNACRVDCQLPAPSASGRWAHSSRLHHCFVFMSVKAGWCARLTISVLASLPYHERRPQSACRTWHGTARPSCCAGPPVSEPKHPDGEP